MALGAAVAVTVVGRLLVLVGVVTMAATWEVAVLTARRVHLEACDDTGNSGGSGADSAGNPLGGGGGC